MIMESPVRICLGAALVVHVLLLISTFRSGSALPLETTSTTIKDEKSSRYARPNSTWTIKTKPKTPDAALNELRKDSASEENTDKNAKYKDRGRVRFNPFAKSTTESSLRRVTIPTEASNVVIVTPTPEVKKPAQIIDSMKTYKKTKMPSMGSSTTPSVFTESKFGSDEQFDSDEDDDLSSFGKYTSIDDFFSMPSFDSDDFMKKNKRGSDKKAKDDFSTPVFSDFSSYFSDDTFNSKDEPYKSDSFFDFDKELTTPKNDFFDKKFSEITSSIINNKQKKDNIGLQKYTSGTPTNKSTVIIKNTKEFRVFDNDEAGTSNKELSDVHGTSIYYEMSVLSTETYNISHSDEDDCDNDTIPSDAAATTAKEERPLIATVPTFIDIPTNPTISDSIPEAYSTVPSNILPVSINPTIFNSISPVAYSSQNGISSTEHAKSKLFPSNSIAYSTQNVISSYENGKTKDFPSSSIPFSTQYSIASTENENTRNISSAFTRSRNYSKRLNLTGNKDSPNSVTVQADQVSINQGFRPLTRRFHYTTPKIKPIWMAPRKNITRGTYSRSTYPTTIYSEHFNIKDRFSATLKPKSPTRTVLTTSPSDIDPVLQTDVSGSKKIVHSPSISDNTIPTLWKRGSTKFSSSTATSAEVETNINEMEIPPTLTAWALASLRSPPSLLSPVVNSTVSTLKSVDENELQKVGDSVDVKDSIISSKTTTGTPSIFNNEILPKNITEVRQPWKPLLISTSPNSNGLPKEKSTEFKSETQPAESNIYLQSSPQGTKTTVSINTNSSKTTEPNSVQGKKPYWIPAKVELDETTTEESRESSIVETIPPVDATKSTGFESITKLPAGITTPMDETIETSEGKKETVTKKVSILPTTKMSKIPTTTDYEITTIRFSYIPTEEVTESTETEPSTIWHPIIPTRTKPTTFEDSPITTYRPKYITTSEPVEESTTSITIETTEKIEASSQVIDNEAQKSTPESGTRTTYTVDTTTENSSTGPTTTEIDDKSTIVSETTTMKTITTKKAETETFDTTEYTEEEKTTSTEVSTHAETHETTVLQTDSDGDSPRIETTETDIQHTEIHQTDAPQTEKHDSHINSGSNEIIQATTQAPKITPPPITVLATPPEVTTPESTTKLTTAPTEPSTTETIARIVEITTDKETTDATTDDTTTSDDYMGSSEMTTESSSRVLTDEAGSGAAVAIAVSTIGVIALVLLVGLLVATKH